MIGSNVGIVFNNKHLVSQEALSTRVYDYYNNKKDDRNLAQATDGYVHHHFGLGPTLPHENIIEEIQRQENALTSHIISLLGIKQDATVLDIACGRGGNMFRIADEFPNSTVTGINITEYQTKYCNDQIALRELKSRLEVNQGDFLDMPYQDETFTNSYCCEVTQYALDLKPLFDEVYRTMKKGGKFIIATWCYNADSTSDRVKEIVEPINDHYASTMHSNKTYAAKLIEAGFKIVHDEDRTEDLIPYWELRKEWGMASGIEDEFIEGHKDGTLLYKFFIGTKKA